MLREVQPSPNLSVLNRRPHFLSGPKYLHQLVRQSPATDAPAIDFLENGVKRRKLSYAELHTASDALATRIRTNLAGLKDASAVIPVLLPQSPELYVALLAILKAGKAFCPIGLDAPPERVAFILSDISANILITTTAFMDQIPADSNIEAIFLEHTESAQFHCNTETEILHQEQTRLAYVLYTSGSTGLPKAVSVSHRAVTQSLLAHDQHIPSFTRFLQFAAPTFDVSIFEIFFPLFRGFTLVGCTRTHMLNDLPATITSLGVDAAELTPTVVSNLLRGRKSVPGLRLLLTIGEMLTRDIVDEYGGTGTRASMLWGMYGPTEAAIHCTLQPEFSCTSSLGNIGFPLDTVTAIIAAPVSKDSTPQSISIIPRGEVGELVIGGPQVADEYLNRSDLTAASFIHDQELGYLYRTGDKARLCSDGTLECLGRITSGQVKLRGQRVELGEIEQTIIKVKGCYSTVVMVIEDTLVAFCAMESSTTSGTSVQETCRLWLPNYMVPTHIVFIDRMPQLPSGKVDRRYLEANYLNGQLQPSSQESQFDHEETNAIDSILREVLGRRISDDEDFTNIGLDSLRSIRIASCMREQGFDVNSIDVLASKSLKQLKEIGKKKLPMMTAEHTGLNLSHLLGIAELQPYRSDIADILPCTPLQEAMLTETAIKPSAYCNWIEVEILGQHNFSQLRELLEIIVQQNEILRTGFCVANSSSGSFVQVVWKQMQPNTVLQVSTLTRAHSLGSTSSLLRPFTVQINTTTGRPRLLFQIHHSLYDGWSFDLLLQDLNQLLLGNSISERPQFRQVVDYYLQFLGSEELSISADYWRQVLHEYHPTALPNFNGKIVPYSGLRSLRGKYSIDPECFSASVHECAVGPQVFFQAAVAHVLSQYLGTSDVVIGNVTSGRTIPLTKVEEIMGPCIAALPFRVDVSCITVRELLQKIQQANRKMLEHCVLPLRDIASLCQLHPGERLFDVLFVWQESLVSADNRKLALRIIDSVDDSEFRVTFEVEPCENHFAYRITYDPSTIPDNQVEYLATQVYDTARYFISNLDGKVDEAKEHLNLDVLSISNSQPEIKPILRGPGHSVQDWAMRTPDRDAIIVGAIVDGKMRVQERLSYASLNARANQFARSLVALGVGNDQLVCIILEKSIDLYISILAVLKTGCGYLPIVPDTPTERINRILADAGVKFCIGNSRASQGFQQAGLVVLDPTDPELSKHSSGNLAIPYNGNHLAYAVFTSGSTGTPKGVLVTQDNLMHNLEYLSTLYPYDEDSKLLQSCSQAFDVSVFEIFFSWYVGICLCTATKDDLFYDIETAINDLGITHLSLTPTVAGLIDPMRVPQVQFLVTAGEAVTEGVKRRWAGKGLYQGYGPSETTNICTVKPHVTDTDLINNIGPVFPNTSLIIMEPGSNNIVLRGAVGELCFGGGQVFRGYLNRPDLNAERILELPEYGRIYRSGDMGRLLPHGDVLSTGRLDDQVKIRGQRVELGEVTTLALNLPYVHDCATVLIEDDNGSQRLVVFWVPTGSVLVRDPHNRDRVVDFFALVAESYRPQILEIFDTLSLQLPAYMVPTHLIPISSIPMTPQAKIDKRSLRSTFSNLKQEDLDLTSTDSTADPDNHFFSVSEEKIAKALSNILMLPMTDIKRSSSFFGLGLDSVSAIRFAKDLRDAGLGHLPVSVILKNPTLKRLSAVLAEPSGHEQTAPESQISNIFDPKQLSRIHSVFSQGSPEIDRILPCTPLQEAMLSASLQPVSSRDTQSSGEVTSYYNIMAFSVHGDLERLKKCWERIVARHDILRTTFVLTDNPLYSFAQVILRNVPVIWDDIESTSDVGAYAGKVLSDLIQSRRPPMRLAIQMRQDSARLIFCCHHALYDGVAITAILEEVQDLYFERELPIPTLFEVYLRHMVSVDLEEALQYWKAALSNFEPTYFPSLSGKISSPSQTAGSVQKVIQIPLSEVLKQCRQASTSLLSVVHGSWAKLLHMVTGETDLCFGNVMSGRTLPEEGLDRLTAPCFNTLPVRLNFDFQNSNIELCKNLHAFNVDVLPFQLTPLRWIQSNTRQEQGRLFDTLVILQQPSTSLDRSIWSLEMDDGDMDIPLVCEVLQDTNADTLSVKLHYQHTVCQKNDAEILADIFDNALQSLVRLPKSAANDTIRFPDQLLAQSNMNFKAFDLPKDELLHSAFERNAIEMPESVALDFNHQDGTTTTLTFRSLNEKANQLAYSLIQFGIQPEDVVPVYMPKCPEYYISILGVLKAGAAFSPMYPDLPEMRRQYMVSDLQPKMILAREDTLPWLEGTIIVNVTSIQSYPVDNPATATSRATSMAYCLYTSGSTGLPKAVSMEHRSPIQTIESSRSLIPWNHNSRLLQYAAITFDMCYYDCFLAWTLGFTLCAADQDTMLNNLTGSINYLNVDLLELTPSVAVSLRRSEIPSVRWLYCIGEAMAPEILDEWTGACVNSYGPTEAAFCTTIFSPTPGVKASVIGKPFPTTSFAVFPPQGERPVTILGTGELYIGGTQVARGYFGQPELTEERFVSRCGQRFYKSGDIVRMLSDGNFEFIGRTDDQVKIRGLRVELDEINKTLKSSDENVAAVTTQILKMEDGQKNQLVSFFELRHSGNKDEQLRVKSQAERKAKDILPSYMVPQFFLFVDKIPRSLAGKVDKKALAHIFRETTKLQVGLNEEHEASSYPWNQREELIRSIFSQLSGTQEEDITPCTTIYQLGLDSISAIQIAAALRKRDMQVTASDVMRYMSCKDLAIHLERSSDLENTQGKLFDFNTFEEKHRKEVERTCDVPGELIEAIRPCTPLQNGMLSQFIAKDSRKYFNYIRLRLMDSIDLDRLKNAWSATIQKHRMLRTGFTHVNDDDTHFAMIHYSPELKSSLWDSGISSSVATEEWLHRCECEVIKNLHRPPWRVRVDVADGVNYLDLALLHSIFDGQSLRFVFDDVIALYSDKPTATITPLEPVIANILYMGNKENTTSDDFWKRLGKVTTPTRFPNMAPLRYDPAPPAVLVKSSSRTLEELDMGCRASNISLQVAGLASWATLLSAYVGDPSVTFGIVLSGREDANTAVFPCITTVPFVSKISANQDEVLRDVMSLNIEIQQHQFTPLNRIQRLMGVSNEVLFDSLFAFQKLANDSGLDEPWTVVDEQASTEYSISIELQPEDGRLKFRLTFLPHVVPKEQASLILEQLDHILQIYIFSTSKEQEFSPDLYSITPANTPTIPSDITLLHEFVENTAAKCPNRTAFEFASSLHPESYESQTWTYAQLDSEGNKIANLLISQGLQPGELVGVCFDKCPEASFAILGILKAGCAFVALDPGAPVSRKVFILEDSRAPVLLSMAAQSASFKESTTVTLLNLDEANWRSTPSTKPVLSRSIDSQDRSYCLYTSGTTGTPKGCELTHENAVQAMLAFTRLFSGHWHDDSRWLQFASFHFDVSVLEQYWSWSVGICVVSAPRDLIFEDLASSIRTLQITHIDLTPSLARIISPEDVPTLCKGIFITGGESLKQEILDTWGPKSVIYNGYGPTEATIGCTMYPRVPKNGKPSNIGPQFDNVGSYVLRPGSDVPLLRGGLGELCVSGKLVGKGYLNRPELTKERFAHLDRFNERVYRTGDLVRILHDLTFDFLGRADDQIKLRGQRLEIGEINSVIKQCGVEVADVATLVLKHPQQQKEQLVSFVVIGAGTRGDTRIMMKGIEDLTKVKISCQDRMPPYMVPTHFVALTAMPLSANNKAEVRKLKELYENLSATDLQLLSLGTGRTNERWSKLEEELRDALGDTLNIVNGDFGKDLNFFELGMDSISVIGVSKALKKSGFQKATVSVIMKNATIRRLAKILSDGSLAMGEQSSIFLAQQVITATKHRHSRTVAEALFLDTRRIEALAPCTPLQQGMIARSLESENGIYFNSFQFNIRNDVNLDKLRDAWNHVFASTQVLRTVFVNTDDGFVQAVIQNSELPFSHILLSQAGQLEECLAQEKKKWVTCNQTHIKTPIQILFVESPEMRCFILHMFHGLYDGNSINLILKAVWNAYNSKEVEPGPDFHSILPCGPLRPTVDARKFWERHIADRHFQSLPNIEDRAEKGAIVVTREVEGVPNFDSTRRKLNVTSQAIAQACWTGVLHQFIQTTVTLGLVVSGRNIDCEGADQVIGPLFNTIPYQYRGEPDETWASTIVRAHDFNVTVQPYQHTPLRDIMKWIKRGPTQPLFDTLFAYQIAEGTEECEKNELWELQDDGAEPDYPLAIEVEQKHGGAMKVTLVAQNRVMDLETANLLLGRYEEAFRQALENIDTVLETFVTKDKIGVNGTTLDTKDKTYNEPKDVGEHKWCRRSETIRREIADLAGVGIEEINAKISIFEFGLDSIDAIKLSSKLKKHGINIQVSGILRSQNIANMMDVISTTKEQKNARPSDMIYKANKKRLENYLRRQKLTEGVEQVLPLTPLQEAMVAEMVASDYKRYYNHDVLKLKAGVDILRLKQAWAFVVMESPILRTSFVPVDDPSIDFSYAQVVHYNPHEFWRSTYLDHEPDFHTIFETIREMAAKHPSHPLFHVCLVQSPQAAYLILSIAHALYDGWSLGLLHSDVHQAYMGNIQKRPSYEPALHEILTTSGPDAAAFWRDYLSGATAAGFPLRSPNHLQTVHRMEQSSYLSLETVKSFARTHNFTLQTIGQAAHGAVVASYTNSLDVTFGSVLSGRDDETRSKLLFPTMNTVTIRTILHGTRNEMLQYVQDNYSNIKQWQHFPLRKALSLAGAQGNLLQSLFIYQKNMRDGTEQPEKLYESVQGQSSVEYPVCVEMEVVGNTLVWRCAVKDDVLDESGAYNLLERLDSVLDAIITHPEAPVIDFTASGTSICGLPTCTSAQAGNEKQENNETEKEETERSASATTAIIREVLAFVSQTPEEEITPGMTIFHIGLDSISAIKIASLLRKRGIVLNVGEMLRAGTAEEMARIVDGRAPNTEEEIEDIGNILKEALSGIDQPSILKEAGLEAENVEYMLPATAGQIYMLSTWLNSNGVVLYPEFHYRIHGSVSFEVVQKAWETVVAQNAILRTSFVAANHGSIPYAQAVMRTTDVSIHDVTALSEEALLSFKIKTAARQPYVHLFVSRPASSDSMDIQLKVHHALYDGVSLPLLLQELQDFCRGVQGTGATDSLPKLIATMSTSSVLQRRKNFWLAYLRDLPQRLLPQPNNAITSRTEIFRPSLLSSVTNLESQAHKHGLTTQSLFLATYAKIYAGLTSTPTSHDVVIGLYLANRSLFRANLHQAAIPTVNLVPLRVSTPLETSILDVAAQIQYDIQEISAPANASVALNEINEWTGLKVDTFVNFLKLPAPDEDIGEEAIRITSTQQWSEASSRVVVDDGHDVVPPPRELVNERVNGVYLHALDIEATVRNGALDMGIFAPERMLGLEEGGELMERMRMELGGIVKAPV